MKKKICIFASYFPLSQGGAEYQSYLIAKSLNPKYYDIFFLSFNRYPKSVIEMDNFTIYSISTNRLLSKFGKPYFLYYFKIKQILSQEKPDIVYRRMESSILGILCLLKKKLKFKLIWACASTNGLTEFKLHGLKNILTNFDELFRIYGIKNADKILVQTNEQKQLLLKRFNRDSIIFPNLHPTDNIESVKKGKNIKILWIANFKHLKQPDYFIDLSEEFQNYTNIEFVMIGRLGKGKFWENLNDRMKRVKNIECKGELSLEDVQKTLAESHILINTSLYEGFSNTFIQAWMHKVPVISLNVDPDDMIKNNKIGFHSRTFRQLVKDTKTLIEDNNLRIEMGEIAYKFAIEKFSCKNICKLIRLIESV